MLIDGKREGEEVHRKTTRTNSATRSFLVLLRSWVGKGQYFSAKQRAEQKGGKSLLTLSSSSKARWGQCPRSYRKRPKSKRKVLLRIPPESNPKCESSARKNMCEKFASASSDRTRRKVLEATFSSRQWPSSGAAVIAPLASGGDEVLTAVT